MRNNNNNDDKSVCQFHSDSSIFQHWSAIVKESFVCNKDIKKKWLWSSIQVVDKCKSAPSKVQNGAPDKKPSLGCRQRLACSLSLSSFRVLSSTLLYVLHLLMKMYFTNCYTREVVLSRISSLPFISTKGYYVCLFVCVFAKCLPHPLPSPHHNLSLIWANFCNVFSSSFETLFPSLVSHCLKHHKLENSHVMDDRPFSMETLLSIVIWGSLLWFVYVCKTTLSQYGMQGTKRFTSLFFSPF